MSERYISAKIIDNLYKEFLGRNADPDGLKYHMRHFEELGVARGTQHSVSILVNSDEFHYNFNSRKRISFPCGKKLINGKSIEHVISLGNHCLPAMITKKYGIKNYSTPFDWIFSSPEMVIDCLEDNFATLMNRSYHKSITNNRKNRDFEPGTSHELYEEKYSLSEIFAHRDITNDDDFSYFIRAINRFNSILNGDSGKIFIMTSRPNQNLELNFEKLSNCLTRRTNNFALYAFQLKKPVGIEMSASVKLIRKVEDSYLFEFSPSVDEGLTGRFDNHLDESVIISKISEYNINLRA